uniref:THAP domain-containing protein 2 n=1 Tax=Schizaphis graminum TaxID=13262 RepID=A0A2S2NTZ3_SCHGA
MPSCFICGRSRNGKSNVKNITFHKFPNNERIREKWLNFVRENNLLTNKITKFSVICSSHFDEKNFINYKRTRLLEKEAVPYIIISRAKYAKVNCPEFATIPSTSTNEVKTCTSNNSKMSVQSNIKTLVKVSNNIQVDGIIPFDECSHNDSTTVNIIQQSVKKNVKSSYIEASKPNETDTPNRTFLKHGISALSSELLIKSKKLKLLSQTVRRQRKKIASMKQILLQLKNKNLINIDEIEILMENFDSQSMCKV